MLNLSKLKLQFTTPAKEKIKKLINKNINLKFRIYITGGGCNGFQYQFKIDNIIHKNDIIIKKKITIVIDAISFQYIDGSVIDYQQTLLGSKFTVSNPHAKTTCSCGSSFSI
ncbi:iron-sulfur cluster insertion protein ErpA [Buchnera aphidicola]|uniref:Iron-sulfur cluster insertion protein ErpA n=1 Tax=Buchnera aphidicola (Sarucallis kahawaluokalani) TaxID=1241878 RepID=A0A4D6Y9A3_9GAMM|nr:iron-sulfur cluster insertion protein ErpA [Buchnera aphidicola]QCI25949.1 iron-sulfur cluster insertion protein ErpA [Buchnera aphidicola (Sarucallis kahawaluokalani)]